MRKNFVKYIVLCWVLIFFNSVNGYTQGAKPNNQSSIDSLVLYVNNKKYSTTTNWVEYNGQKHLAFLSNDENQNIVGRVYLDTERNVKAQLMSSSDFDIIDSTLLIDKKYYSFKIRLKNVTNGENLSLKFRVLDKEQKSKIIEFPLYTHLPVYVDFHTSEAGFYTGESRTFQLRSNQINNILIDGYWKRYENFNYRLERDQNQAYIYLEPSIPGQQTFKIRFETIKPIISDGKLTTNLPELEKKIIVKNQRITLLKFDERLIVRDPFKATRHIVTVSNHNTLELNKIYRIEDSEGPNATLIAELIPRRNLSNDKIECEIRPYNNHMISAGNLYVKQDGKLLFITQLEIIPAPIINKVSILKPGSDWTTNLVVRPGETFKLRIQGRYLKNTTFYFDELYDLKADSLQNTDDVAYYQLMVPIYTAKKEIKISLNKEETNFVLNIQEHNKPRPLDFLTIDYGKGSISTESINHPILDSKTLSDLVIGFDPSKIDTKDQLFGRQHIRISVRMEDKNGRLLESTIIGSFFICPGESSPRHAFYSSSQCRMDEIRLNEFLRTKTYSMPEWGKIEVNIEHVNTSYNSEGYFKSIVIYNEKRISFDVDVSVPAGLFIQNLGKDEPIASLSGISFAMIAQFSFYKNDEIKKILPFKAGAGFIAKNAFNFNQNADRDLGVIAIASAYPIPGTSKVSFPLYAGLGYFLQENKFFALIGPGIRVTF